MALKLDFNYLITTCCIPLLTVLVSCNNNTKDSIIVKHSTSFYMDAPATNWNESLPIGNGRLGGMIWGGTDQELIQTNDDTFWSGEPRSTQNDTARNSLPTIRELLLEDKTTEAEELINTKMLGEYNQCYMPLVDIILDINHKEVINYRRDIDLSRGVVTISYEKDNIKYKREIFSSFPDQSIVIKMSSDGDNNINFTADLKSKINYESQAEGNVITIKGQAPIHTDAHYLGVHPAKYKDGRGMRFEGRLLVKQEDGEVTTEDNKIAVNGANNATLIFVAATSYNGYDKDPALDGKDEAAECDKYLTAIEDKEYKEIYNDHIADFKSLFDRVSIDMGTSQEADMPINKRVEAYKKGIDPALTALYFQYGRYLLISASRPGSQPSNLQGIWSNEMQPAWGSNWTINCNTQINYWPVEMANLSECHLPLIDMINEASVDGAKTASKMYGARGWMAHHNLDIWRTTWPVGGSGLWAVYQVGGAWLCQHIWEHYQFTLDKEFLNENYNILKGAALFYIDNLQRDKEGYLVTNPSESFENTFTKPDGKSGWACVGAAQDMQIIRSLFNNTIKTIDVLGEDKEFRSQVVKALDELAPMKISPSTGRLQEWNDDWKASSPHNGQVAHGWGFVASDLITLRGTPELAAAFRKTLEHRKPEKSYNSGSWTGAFPAGYWARFEEADSVQNVVDRHFDLALFPNLTSVFFGKYWEIDGNLGFTSAIGEMLLQSHAGEINLLPALSNKYPNGFVNGLKARGAYEVDIKWENNTLTTATITSDKGGEFTARYKDDTAKFSLQPNQTIIIDGNLEKIN